MATKLIYNVEVVDPCSRTIKALHGAVACVPIEFSVEEFAVHRVVHFLKI